MLKKICGLFLGLVVCAGSACVTPTHASSAFSVVLTHIQAASSASAKDEMVSMYNNSPNEVDISNWCIKNKSSVSFACFETDSTFAYYLPPYSFAIVATESFVNTAGIPLESVTKYFEVTNQSSGSIVNSNDTISLVDAAGQMVNSFSWTTAIPSGKAAIRTKSATDPRIYETLDPSLSWSYAPLSQMPVTGVVAREIIPVQPTDPADDTPDPEPQIDPDALIEHPIITELLPDADGSDVGNEFIELYNPTAVAIHLDNYKLRVGPGLEKAYSFPTGAVIEPSSYLVYTNSQISFTLVNTTSSIELEYKGQLVWEAITYTDPPTSESWALVNNTWRYTDTPTPGGANQISTNTNPGDDSDISTSTAKPCAANQYRSPETNRCRLIATSASTTLTPCKVGQERSAETNRCRNIAATSTPAACKEGQERNPETSRCRNIVKMTDAGYGVKGMTTEQTPTNWYLWLGIAGVVALILGYATWEWREELKHLFENARRKFARTKH